MAMTQAAFNKKIVTVLSESDDPQMRKVGKWLAKEPVGPIQKRIKRRVEEALKAQVETIIKQDTKSDGEFADAELSRLSPEDWQKILSFLGPFIKIILAWIGL